MFNLIYNAMFQADSPAPVSRIIGFKRFGFSRTVERRFAATFEQVMDFFNRPQVILYKPTQILPCFGHKNKFKHESSV